MPTGARTSRVVDARGNHLVERAVDINKMNKAREAVEKSTDGNIAVDFCLQKLVKILHHQPHVLLDNAHALNTPQYYVEYRGMHIKELTKKP